jgi:hypothetical protein
VTNLLTALTPTKFDRIAFAGYRVSGSASANLARIASYFKINGGSGAQHGGGGSGARFDPMSGDPTDMIAQGLRSRRNT